MLKSTRRDVRALLDRQRVLTLAVLVDGAPYAALLPFAPLADRSGTIVHASSLARHARGLVPNANVSVLLHESDAPDRDPLQLPRVTLDSRVVPLERGTERWHEARRRYLARFPGSAVTFELGDFTLHCLLFESGLYVAGFGRAIALPRDDIQWLRGDDNGASAD